MNSVVTPSTWARLGAKLRIINTVGSSFAVFGLQAVHAILLARLLGPTGRGEYGTAMFYAQSMIYIGLAGTLYSIARNAAKPQQFALLQRSALRVGIITGLLSMCIAIGLSLLALPADKRYLIPFCVICAAMLPPEHIRLTTLAVEHGRGMYNRYNLSRVFSAAVFPLLILALYVNHITSLWLITSLTVVVPIAGYLFYYAISDCKQLRGPAAPRPWQLIREGRPDGVAVLAGDVFDRLGHFLLLWLVTLEDYGFYVTALPAASMLVVAPHALALFAFNAAANDSRGPSAWSMLRAAGMVVAIQAVTMLCLLALLEPLLMFVYGEEFRGVIPVTRVLVIALAINGCALVGDGYLRGRSLASLGVWTRVVAAIVMLISFACLTTGTPLIRVAMAAAIGYAVNTVLTAILSFRTALLAHRGVSTPRSDRGAM